MDKIKKLFLKISKKDREMLLKIIEAISSGDKGLKVIKIKKTDFFRVRYKQFRIIFHKDNNEVVVDSIRLWNENTYKNL